MASSSSNSLKSQFSKGIKFTYDLSEFEKKVNEFMTETQSKTKDILVAVAPDFSNYAAKYTPPSIGKNSIDKKFYTRPILVLSKLLAGEYQDQTPTEEDRKQIKNKMKFKVLYTKNGIKKGTAFAYTKSISQAKKAAKIANRGISRVMWGKNLSTINANVPASLQRLIRKSPSISKHDFNKVSLKVENDETSVEVVNSVKNVQRYAKMAEKHGYKKVSSSIMRELKKIADKKVEV